MTLSATQIKERRDTILTSRTVTEAAEKLDLTPNQLGNWARANGIKPAYEREKNRKRMELYHMGLSDREIGARVGAHSETIRIWRRHWNLPLNARVRTITIAADVKRNHKKRELPEQVREFFRFLLNVKGKYPQVQIDVLQAAQIYREG